jgi:hypothetical protein
LNFRRDVYHEARTFLKPTRRELADATDVPLWFVVAAFEADRDILPFYEIEIRAALEAV